jgi:hypothetical protein
MTDLNRSVSRRTRSAYAVLFTRPARIVVTLAAGDVLNFRHERRRRTWSLPIEAAFRAAVHRQATREAAQKKGRRHD